MSLLKDSKQVLRGILIEIVAAINKAKFSTFSAELGSSKGMLGRFRIRIEGGKIKLIRINTEYKV